MNWFSFCQQVRVEYKNHRVCPYPDIGLVLKRRTTSLTVMRSKLSGSPAGADFTKELDKTKYEQIKTLLLTAYAQAKPEWLAKIEAAKSLSDMQNVFNEIMDESQAESVTDIAAVKDSA